MFKLTTPVTVIDVNGNSKEAERTFVFDNKEELIEFISGDTDGYNYGSSLIRIKEYDNELYTQVGKVCNYISCLLQNENTKEGDLNMKHYIVSGEDRYEPGEIEKEFNNLDDARQYAGHIIDDGGFAEITDEEGRYYAV